MPFYFKRKIHVVGEYKFFEFIETAPSGWAIADGSEVSRSGKFARLFNLIGTTYGAGDGSTTFNLPDRRGEFIRAFDAGRGKDAGRVQGSSQASQNRAHSHTGTLSLPKFDLANGSKPPYASEGAALGVENHSVSISTEGGGEARPENFAALLCIKL